MPTNVRRGIFGSHVAPHVCHYVAAACGGGKIIRIISIVLDCAGSAWEYSSLSLPLPPPCFSPRHCMHFAEILRHRKLFYHTLWQDGASVGRKYLSPSHAIVVKNLNQFFLPFIFAFANKDNFFSSIYKRKFHCTRLAILADSETLFRRLHNTQYNRRTTSAAVGSALVFPSYDFVVRLTFDIRITQRQIPRNYNEHIIAKFIQWDSFHRCRCAHHSWANDCNRNDPI